MLSQRGQVQQKKEFLSYIESYSYLQGRVVYNQETEYTVALESAELLRHLEVIETR